MKEKHMNIFVDFLDLLSSFNKVWIEIFGIAFTIIDVIYFYVLIYREFTFPALGFVVLYTAIVVLLLYIYFRNNKDGGFSHLFSCKK